MAKPQPQSQFPTIESLGFVQAQPVKPRMILNLQGLRKSGKTSLALSFKRPVYYLSCGDNGLLSKTDEELQGVYLSRVPLPDIQPGDDQRKTEPPNGKEPGARWTVARFKAVSYWDKLDEEWRTVTKSGTPFRTIVIDGGEYFWDLCLLCEFGRTTQIMPKDRAHPNAVFRSFLYRGVSSGAHFIAIHHMKEEWKNDKPTGRMVADSWKHVHDLFPITMEMTKYFPDIEQEDGTVVKGDLRFEARVTDSQVRQAEMINMAFRSDEGTLDPVVIGQMFYPDSAEEDWR